MSNVLVHTPKVGYRHVLAVDIVALSNPALHHDEQRKKIEVLNQSLLDSEVYKNAQIGDMKLEKIPVLEDWKTTRSASYDKTYPENFKGDHHKNILNAKQNCLLSS